MRSALMPPPKHLKVVSEFEMTMSRTKESLSRLDGPASCASFMHPNPRFYKYRWQIYTENCEWEGGDFFENAPQYCTAACMARLQALDVPGVKYLLYNYIYPRRFEGMPFDPQHAKWQSCQWAPSWEDDPDPVWKGFK